MCFSNFHHSHSNEFRRTWHKRKPLRFISHLQWMIIMFIWVFSHLHACGKASQYGEGSINVGLVVMEVFLCARQANNELYFKSLFSTFSSLVCFQSREFSSPRDFRWDRGSCLCVFVWVALTWRPECQHDNVLMRANMHWYMTAFMRLGTTLFSSLLSFLVLPPSPLKPVSRKRCFGKWRNKLLIWMSCTLADVR